MFRRISMYFGSINHQDNSCPGFPAAKSGTAALLMVFQGVAGAPGKLFTERLEDKFPFQYFKSSKNFLFLWSFEKTTWSIELRRAEVGSGWWTATKKVNLISRDCNQEEWRGGAPLFQNMQSPEAVSELSEFVIHFRKHGHGKIEKDIIYDTRLTT